MESEIEVHAPASVKERGEPEWEVMVNFSGIMA